MLQAQKKKDLIAEVAQLKDSISGLNDSISKANRQINSSNANAALFEKENTELRDANATLLKKINLKTYPEGVYDYQRGKAFPIVLNQ